MKLNCTRTIQESSRANCMCLTERCLQRMTAGHFEKLLIAMCIIRLIRFSFQQLIYSEEIPPKLPPLASGLQECIQRKNSTELNSATPFDNFTSHMPTSHNLKLCNCIQIQGKFSQNHIWFLWLRNFSKFA